MARWDPRSGDGRTGARVACGDIAGTLVAKFVVAFAARLGGIGRCVGGDSFSERRIFGALRREQRAGSERADSLPVLVDGDGRTEVAAG